MKTNFTNVSNLLVISTLMFYFISKLHVKTFCETLRLSDINQCKLSFDHRDKM